MFQQWNKLDSLGCFQGNPEFHLHENVDTFWDQCLCYWDAITKVLRRIYQADVKVTCTRLNYPL